MDNTLAGSLSRARKNICITRHSSGPSNPPLCFWVCRPLSFIVIRPEGHQSHCNEYFTPACFHPHKNPSYNFPYFITPNTSSPAKKVSKTTSAPRQELTRFFVYEAEGIPGTSECDISRKASADDEIFSKKYLRITAEILLFLYCLSQFPRVGNRCHALSSSVSYYS